MTRSGTLASCCISAAYLSPAYPGFFMFWGKLWGKPMLMNPNEPYSLLISQEASLSGTAARLL